MISPGSVRAFSDELVALQKPVRVLNAVAWDEQCEEEFFANHANSQPNIDADYYSQRRALKYDPAEISVGLKDLISRIKTELGSSAIAELLTGRAVEYLSVLEMLSQRGTPRFSELSGELYGTPDEQLHPDGPTLSSLGDLMNDALSAIDSGDWEPPEEREFTAAEGVEILKAKLDEVEALKDVRVILDDGIVADAAAGSSYIKLREGAFFSKRDLRVLEVHEGWVHVATSINGRSQPWCTFLGKGTPSTTSTQEGLAVFTEITTMSSTPERLRKVTRRMQAIGMAQDGATFLDVYRWMIELDMKPEDAWSSCVRVFRGSTPTGKPFTKDLVYSRGFLEVYDFMRLAVRHGKLDRIPLLFAGKLAIRELGAISALAEEGLVLPPESMPPHFTDLSAMASWMAYSSLLNQIDLGKMEIHLADALD